MPYEGVLYALILTTSLLVLFDARGLGARKGGLGGGLLDMGYVGWFIACLLFWIIAFPCYLLKRPRLVRAHALASAPASWQPGVLPPPLVQNPQPYSREYAAAYGLPWTEPTILSDAAPAPIGPAGPTRVSSSIGVQLAGLVAIVAVIALAIPVISRYERTQAVAYGSPVVAADTPAPQVSLATMLANVTLRSTDFPHGYSVKLVPHGDQVAGQVTLDNCGYRFTTEAARIARREVDLFTASGEDANVENEAVVYDTSARATLALHEWSTAAAHCPRTPVRSATTGKTLLTERVTSIQQDVPGLPLASNAFTVENLTVKGVTLHAIAVLQVRDRTLDAVYVVQSHAVTEKELRGILAIAAVTGQRLAAQ